MKVPAASRSCMPPLAAIEMGANLPERRSAVRVEPSGRSPTVHGTVAQLVGHLVELSIDVPKPVRRDQTRNNQARRPAVAQLRAKGIKRCSLSLVRYACTAICPFDNKFIVPDNFDSSTVLKIFPW